MTKCSVSQMLKCTRCSVANNQMFTEINPLAKNCQLNPSRMDRNHSKLFVYGPNLKGQSNVCRTNNCRSHLNRPLSYGRLSFHWDTVIVGGPRGTWQLPTGSCQQTDDRGFWHDLLMWNLPMILTPPDMTCWRGTFLWFLHPQTWPVEVEPSYDSYTSDMTSWGGTFLWFLHPQTWPVEV